MKLKTYPKVLIISDAAWADDNNIGNTFSNLFRGWPQDKIAMLYARPNLPSTTVCDNFFQISEIRLLKSIFKKNTKSGINLKEIEPYKVKRNDYKTEEDVQNGKKLYSFFLKYRWNIFISAREILWSVTDWKSDELNIFIDDFKPDIILSLADSSIYLNKIQQYVIKRTKAKSIIYFVDDVYSNKRFNLSPIFWINRLLSRRHIKNTVNMCDLVYTIIDKQKKEYDKYFRVNSKILNKGDYFTATENESSSKNEGIRLIYTGNITSGRWQSLAKIGEALDKINKDQYKATLEIYTRNALYPEIKKTFNKIKSIEFKGSLDADEVKGVQSSGDILVHVESFNLKEKLETRLSFSTKLVDYFNQGKCILAVGWSESASISYLKKNNAGFVVDDIDEIDIALKKLIKNPELIKEYGKNAWNFGFKYHQISNIKNNMKNDMLKLLSK